MTKDEEERITEGLRQHAEERDARARVGKLYGPALDRVLLIRAADIIERAQHLAKGTYARDKRGKETDVDSPDACYFCTTGVLIHVARTRKAAEVAPGEGGLEVEVRLIERVAKQLMGGGEPPWAGRIPRWNDRPGIGWKQAAGLLRRTAQEIEPALVAGGAR